MNGWLLMAGLLAALAVAWFVFSAYSRRRLPRTRKAGARRRPTGRRVLSLRPAARATGPGPGAGRPSIGATVGTDTEIAEETHLPPRTLRDEVQAGESRPEGQTRERSPWGMVAVPTWEQPVPWSYNETRLTALVRDPYWIFAFWEITGEAHRRAEAAVGRTAWARAQSVLRVYDLSRGAHYDVAIDELARNWYLNVGQPDRTWRLEIGRLTTSGRFVMLARSTTVHTPRDAASETIDPRWPPLGYERLQPEGPAVTAGRTGPASPGMPGSPWGEGWAPERRSAGRSSAGTSVERRARR